MSATFKDVLTNIREALNALKKHRHDSLYEPKGIFLGKNLLINGDKTISQRGDFSTPFAPVGSTTYIDGYSISYLVSDVTIDYSHEPYNDAIGSRTLLSTATLSNGSPDSAVSNIQSLLYFEPLLGKTVTYAAMVRSNTDSVITAYFGGDRGSSIAHSGSGEFELLTVTVNVPIDANIAQLASYMTPFGTGTNAGDYFEVGSEQLVIGNAFKGFEYISPAFNLVSCRSHFLPVAGVTLYEGIGTFVAISATEMRCTLFITPMETDTFISTLFNGSTVILEMLGAGTGTITQGTLIVDTTLSDLPLGKLTLKLTGTGFSTGEINIVRKNNDASILGVRLFP